MKYARRFLLTLGVLIFLYCFQAAKATSIQDPCFIPASQVSLTDWLSKIPDEALITEINMPATHDSGTTHMNWGVSRFLASCQNWSISQQLNHGIRVLDIRVAGLKDGQDTSQWWNMQITHDVWRCATGSSSSAPILLLKDVMKDCASFLNNHQGETIVIRLSYDDNKKTAAQSMSILRQLARPENSYIPSFLNGVSLMYYVPGDQIPALKDVRGRIVIIDDASKDKMTDKKDGADSTYEMAYDKDSTALRVAVISTAPLNPIAYVIAKKAYKSDVVDTKESLLKKCFSDAGQVAQAYTTGHGKNPGIWNRDGYYNESGRYGEPGLKVVGTNINTAAKLGPLSPSISDYSSEINDWLKKYNFKNGKRYGWISMDHPTETVIRKIIATNEVKTEKITIDIEWQGTSTHSGSDFGERAFCMAGLEYTQSWTYYKGNMYATLKVSPATAEKLENGSISLEISPSSPLKSRSRPVTYRMEHVGENHWKCIVYEEIIVTLHWDLVTPADAERLLNGFFTYGYVDGQELTVPSSLIRFGRTEGSTTVLYLNLLPELDASTPIMLSINRSGLEYRYTPERDCVKKDLRHWEFTLHINADAADYSGTLTFDDNENKYGFRPSKGDSLWKNGCKLIATASDASEDGDGLRIVFTVPLSVDSESYTWSRNDLPLKGEDGADLTWSLSINTPRGYTISYQSAGTKLDATLTILPFTDVEIRWEGEEGDISKRPESVSVSLWVKSTGNYISSKVANAQNGWRVHFNAGMLQDDWMLKTIGSSALYERTGPFITEDGKGAYFVFTRTNAVKITSRIYWKDGMRLEVRHPELVVTLDNGRETVETNAIGKDKSVYEWIYWNDGDTLPVKDSEGNPYTYTVTAKMEEAKQDQYLVFVQNYDVYAVRKTSLSGKLYWIGSSTCPSWVTEPPTLTLYRRKANSGKKYEAVDAEVEWNLAEGTFVFADLPLGIVGEDSTDRYEYKVAADAQSLPGVASISSDTTYNQQESTYTATLIATLENATTTLPFTITVEDNGFHPEQTFTITLRDQEGTEKAVQSCTVGKNMAGDSFQMAVTLPLSKMGNYTLEMSPIDGGGWTVDTSAKPVTLSARINEETGEVEIVSEGDAPVFAAQYTHDPAPAEAELTFHIAVQNESELSAPPEEDFRLQPYLNEEKGEAQTVTGAGSMTLSYLFENAGTYVVSVDQLSINNWRWQTDENTYSLTVSVSMNEDGELTAEYPEGTETTLENIYLGDTLHVTGGVLWDEDYFAYGTSLRPATVTLTLVPYTASNDAADSLATLTVDVTDDNLQCFDFGWQRRFDDEGNPVEYTVLEQAVPFYETTINYCGYSALNTLSGELVHAAGIITWTDEDETYRPSEVTIRLFSRNQGGNKEELDSITVTPDGEGDWWYDFGFYPLKDTEGATLTYTVDEDAVGGYTTKIDDFMVENIKQNYKITKGDGQQYISGGKTDAIFICNGPFDGFVTLLVDGEEVDRDNYTVTAGSTVLSLHCDWLNTLEKGTHTLCFHYTDGVSDTGTFSVVTIPPTADYSSPWLYICLMLLSAAFLSGMVLRNKGNAKGQRS